MFDLIFLFIMIGYTAQLVIFIIGAKKKYPRISENKLPTATIIVAARNEENNIRNIGSFVFIASDEHLCARL